MTRLAEICMLSFGWRRALMLILAGAVAGLSVPPLYILPALFVGVPVLVWCLDGAEHGTGWRRILGPAFFIGFSFGLGYFLVAIHWIGAAFLVDAGWQVFVMPIGVLALAAVLALFWGFGAALAHAFWSGGPWRILALAAAMTVAEFARGHLLSGFPLDLPGYALAATDQMRQLAAVIGVYGLTALAFGLAGLPALIWPADGRTLTRRLVPFFAIVATIAAQLGYGQYRVESTTVTPRADLTLRLVQPDIAQSVKWLADSRAFVMQRLLDLSTAKLSPGDPGLDGVTALVWPESAMPFFLADQPAELAKIARMLPAGKYLVTGAPRQDFTTKRDYNSILVIDSNGEVVDSYDKTHLVPIGEYLPFGDFFRQFGVTQFVTGSRGWTPGEVRRPLQADGLAHLLPLICYEAVFSGDLGPVGTSDILLNLTNDGWFDGTIGPAQHFDTARLRAVEEGMPLVRVANTGVTALVDPLGQVTASLRPGSVGVLDVTPQQKLTPTLFARFRNWPLLLVLAMAFAGLVLQKRRAAQ